MWQCKNEQCKNFCVDVELPKMDAFIRGGIYLTKEEQKQEKTCKECGEPLTFETPERFKESIPSIAKFDSLSQEDKKKMMYKRYQNAMKKENGHEMIRQKKQERINQMYNKLD